MDDIKQLLGKINSIIEDQSPVQKISSANRPKNDLAESLISEYESYLKENAASTDIPASDYERIKSMSTAKRPGVSSFGQAFRSARESGLDTFTWRGRKYTTQLKEPTVPSRTTVDFPAASRRETDWEKQRASMIKRAEAPASIGMPEVDIERMGLEENVDGVDTVTVDIPLLMRIMEYSREDAQTDMDLHHVAERMISLNKSRDVLTMNDYDAIISKADHEPGRAEVSGSDDTV